TVRDIREDEDSQARYYRRRGCVIASMLESGNASRSGLSPEDILLRIDGREIESLEDVRASYAKAVERPAGKRRLLLSVLRRGRQLLVALDYRRSKAEQEADR
ncbi:MAG: PDZ domain-containing protein, partial [Elusimicrobia bacterium]|nr:PDZ domain-containing protein [Elusimicrobiota bacterium]